MKENSLETWNERIPSTPVDYAVDELNLAEFPLTAISDRFLAGTKTVVLEDTVFDKEENRYLPRRLTLSGSDRYGLPNAVDDDVLLACIQLSRLSDFASREVAFSRYEILRLLGWEDRSRHYERIATSLRRWKGLSIYSDRAFYDHEAKSWVNRDFGVFDNLILYRRDASQGKAAPMSSRLVWNEVLFRNFQSGYLKQLDWNLYCTMKSPVAKRLYRFLDKRFYHGNRVEIDLEELCLRKVRFAATYNTGQMKRALQKGIEELEQIWELRPRDAADRYQKEMRGKWKVVFERQSKRPRVIANSVVPFPVSTIAPTLVALDEKNPRDIERALIKRGIGPATAEELSNSQPVVLIQERLELYDWYNQRGQERGPGFLIQSIKNPSSIAMPKGFESSVQRQERQRTVEAQKLAESNVRTKREQIAVRQQFSRQQAFKAFWDGMSPTDQDAFETEAVNEADSFKKGLYLQHSGKGGDAFELYRQIILKDYFERLHGLADIKPDSRLRSNE